MKDLLLLFTLALSLCVLSTAEAQNSSSAPKHAKRPRIGLVLEGGGAKGFAHVGVLKVLEENHVPIDVVAGTSMGSIVGAAYASGVPVAEMERVLTETDWDELFDETPPRAEIPFRFKPGRNREIFGSGKIGLGDTGMVLPAGLISGQNVLPLLTRLFGRVGTPIRFDELPLPFRAVTADLLTGEAVVPSEGDLASVVRASMSVPGFFSPVKLNGRYLVDGGIVDNLPVELTRTLGADVLVVVTLATDPSTEDDLASPLSISGHVISLVLEQNSNRSKTQVRPGDVVIQANLGSYGSTDFGNSREIMAIGEEAARQMVPQLQRLAVSSEAFANYSARRTNFDNRPQTIEFIRVENDSNTPDETILEIFGVKVGDPFDRAVVEGGVKAVFSSGWYSAVNYSWITESNQTGLVLTVRRRQWFDNYLRFGFALQDDFQGDGTYRVGLNWRTTSLNDFGAYGDLEGEIGRNPRLSGEFYQPLGAGSPYFIAPGGEYGLTKIAVRVGDEVIANYDRRVGIGALRFGRQLGSLGEVAVGFSRGQGKLARDVGDPALGDISYDLGEINAGVALDGLDAVDFPREGYLLRAGYRSSLRDLGASDDFEDYTASAQLPVSFERTTLLLGAEFGATAQNRPIERGFSLGGFGSIEGYEPNSLLASDYWIVQVGVYNRFSEFKLPLFGCGFFSGALAELASVRSNWAGLDDHNGIVAASVFIGADTPLVPAYLAYGVNDEGSHSVILNLGRLSGGRR